MTNPSDAASPERVSDSNELFAAHGYICEAGCIDMGLKSRDPRAIGCVIELDGSPDIEVRGLPKEAARKLGQALRGRVRISIELIGSSAVE
jgi:hypothetical protein